MFPVAGRIVSNRDGASDSHSAAACSPAACAFAMEPARRPAKGPPADVLCGADVLKRDGYKLLEGKRVALDEPGSGTLINARYDVRTRQLSALAKWHSMVDCGLDETWTWDGQAFRLVRRAIMPQCFNVSPDHWFVVYRAQTAG